MMSWACPCGPGYPLQVLARIKAASTLKSLLLAVGFPLLSLTRPCVLQVFSDLHLGCRECRSYGGYKGDEDHG
jgi:hypothetical protein